MWRGHTRLVGRLEQLRMAESLVDLDLRIFDAVNTSCEKRMSDELIRTPETRVRTRRKPAPGTGKTLMARRGEGAASRRTTYRRVRAKTSRRRRRTHPRQFPQSRQRDAAVVRSRRSGGDRTHPSWSLRVSSRTRWSDHTRTRPAEIQVSATGHET